MSKTTPPRSASRGKTAAAAKAQPKKPADDGVDTLAKKMGSMTLTPVEPGFKYFDFNGLKSPYTITTYIGSVNNTQYDIVEVDLLVLTFPMSWYQIKLDTDGRSLLVTVPVPKWFGEDSKIKKEMGQNYDDNAPNVIGWLNTVERIRMSYADIDAKFIGTPQVIQLPFKCKMFQATESAAYGNKVNIGDNDQYTTKLKVTLRSVFERTIKIGRRTNTVIIDNMDSDEEADDFIGNVDDDENMNV